MNHLSQLVGFAGLAFAATALSQSAAYEGTWKASFKNLRGGNQGGTVVVKGNGGSWDMEGSSRNDPCVGRLAPIEVKMSSEDELMLEVQRSKSLTGCPNSTITMKRVDAQTLDGAFPDGRKLTLTRK